MWPPSGALPRRRISKVCRSRTPRPGGNVPSPKLTRASRLKRTATATELAEPSPSKKKAPADAPSKSPPPEKPAAAGEDHHTESQHMATPANEVAELPEKAVAAKKATELQEKAVAAKKVAELPEKAVAAKKVAQLPEKAVAAKKVVKPPPVKKAAAAAASKEVANPPPPTKATAAVARKAAGKEVAYNAEKHLQEMTETYWYLAQEVKVLEREHNTVGMLTAAFLNMADDKAAVLNTEIKKQKMAEAKLYEKRCDINKEVAVTIFNLMK